MTHLSSSCVVSSIDAEGRKTFTIFYNYQYVPKQLKTPKETIKCSSWWMAVGVDAWM